MGVIKKKTAVRGTEGGVKFICDVCSIDITATVRIHCADPICKDYDLCVPCFSEGKSSREHNPAKHSFQVIEQHSVPVFEESWGADEETLLLEGAETYGLGSWADIADHIGGFRDKDEVRDHYIQTYIQSSKFPLPEHASPADRSLIDEWPRDKFQARKKRRIEDRKEAAKNAPPPPPKQKPTSSVPSCHEVQGFMPGRLEFETEHWNEAEEAVQHMQFEPGEGRDPATGNLEPEMTLKMEVMDIYNNRLTSRVERKRLIFEQRLLEYKSNMAMEKKKSKEEKDLYHKLKPFARLMRKGDFDDFTKDMEYEANLRQAISQLQEWRQLQIGDLKSGQQYETEKQQRLARAAMNQYDRFAAARPPKASATTEQPSAVTELTSPTLELRPPGGLATPPASDVPDVPTNKALINGTSSANRNPTSIAHRPKFSMPPLANVARLELNEETSAGFKNLTEEEKELCCTLRLKASAYIAIKDGVLKESLKNHGQLKKKMCKEVARIDPAKGGRVFDFFVDSGWIKKQ
ncbi:MAG: Transcriptional adapter ada2 [Chrysothrix sp. TS-e1954]|nr:MAG: Transcriptional adapter ada2 [Chrysothrix sp. TS-e1954]